MAQVEENKESDVNAAKGHKQRGHKQHPSDDTESSPDLQTWMTKHKIYDQTLHDELLSRGIEDASALSHITQDQFDDVVRRVRMETQSKLKDKKARHAADKLLVRFEKEWRKAVQSEQIAAQLLLQLYQASPLVFRQRMFCFCIFEKRTLC